ncbi:MAG: A/G-specific adenine glycosylase [Gammaproteobacteria bacterium]|nr:A/G-specific adenine glycosylase [Gammaproteobacteria bacterium]
MRRSLLSKRLIIWAKQHGRHHLPWQVDTTPYGIWVSEIMLQQTQVITVIPYYQRFMARFPNLKILANAAEDEVLQHWQGLGYYARGRNLHRAACQIERQHRGCFPTTIEAVVALPGIGRSTAAAILSFSSNQSHAILDGNVKRVLARFHGVEGWTGQSAILKKLWALAEQHTPTKQTGAYNQAIMDLGSILCTRSKPSCTQCPLHSDCSAHRQGRESELPTPRPRKKLPLKRRQTLIIVSDNGECYLEKRPPTGIWGGLWSFPELPETPDISLWCREKLGYEVNNHKTWPTLIHTFSHYRLELTPIYAEITEHASMIREAGRAIWYNPRQSEALGLAAPVIKLLPRLQSTLERDHPNEP